jgi:hypothetical protein
MRSTHLAAVHGGRLHAFLFALALVPCLAAGAPITYVEAGESGRLPNAAESAEAAGIDTLVAIEGHLAAADPSDNSLDVDMFRIYIHDPGAFSARTIAGVFNVVDPMLFLFDANGGAVYMNDDEVVGQSLLPAGHVLGPGAAGVHYLAIAWFNNQPIDAANALLFLAGGLGDVRGPAVATPVADWNDDVLQRIDVPTAYRIELTGTGREPARVPEPATDLLVLACLLALALAPARCATKRAGIAP